MSDGHRNLTDEDIAAIVSTLKSELLRDFYGEVGKGVWGWVKKALFVILLVLALQGMAGDKSVLQSIGNVRGQG